MRFLPALPKLRLIAVEEEDAAEPELLHVGNSQINIIIK